jgi:hypothetical protein
MSRAIDKHDRTAIAVRFRIGYRQDIPAQHMELVGICDVLRSHLAPIPEGTLRTNSCCVIIIPQAAQDLEPIVRGRNTTMTDHDKYGIDL